jgi:hypothetical protein
MPSSTLATFDFSAHFVSGVIVCGIAGAGDIDRMGFLH